MYIYIYIRHNKAIQGYAGVPTEKIHKGRIWEDLMDMWRVFGGILPLYKNMRKNIKTKENVNVLILSYIYIYIYSPHFGIPDLSRWLYTIFDEESKSEVKQCQNLDPGGKN